MTPPRAPRRQRGVAIITALLLTTLAVTIVASLFWMQQVQVRSMENQRLHLQTKWILRGGIDLARLTLRQDGQDRPTYTSLLSVWATPLEETRLDQYVERDRVEGENFDATLSGRIIDATSRYNLSNLAVGPAIDPLQLAMYRRLLTHLQINPALAQKTAQAVADGAPPAPVALGEPQPPARSTVPMGLTQLDDLLAIPGYTLADVNKLREVAIVLPEGATPVNVNTAPAEVIAALVEGYSVAQANSLIMRRKQADFRDTSGFIGQLHGVPQTSHPDARLYDVKSEWFLVRSRVRLDRAALDAESLIKRELTPPYTTTTKWVRHN